MATGMQGGVGLSNGQLTAGMDPAQLGGMDPTAFSEVPHVPDGAPMAAEPVESKPQLRKFMEEVNIAEKLPEDKLRDIAHEVITGYEDDLASREPWERHIEEWTKLAAQVSEDKVYPWPGASNVKYPLVSVAAMQFNARAYPSLVPSDGKIVKTQVIGKDPDGLKRDKADRVSTYMSYQLLQEMTGWEAEMDKLLLMLPIVGVVFKKTFFCPVTKQNKSCLITPKNLVVNYWASCLESAERITETIEMSPRRLKEQQLAGLFLDEELGLPSQGVMPATSQVDVMGLQIAPRSDSTTPYFLLEQHTYLDLNDDGYPEPYVVTVDLGSRKVLRIAARFDDTTIKTNDAGDIIAIDPIQYYTKFPFIPNPDGGFYDIGFGHLLGPINEAVNSLINQLIDAGTLSNLQSGFIGKGLRLRMGETRLQPGEWRAVNSTGDDLRKQIVPLPMKEPSSVLFQLMGTLVSSGKELASVAEIFVGKMPGQNTPATTTMATIEQGMKVFTAVYKRVYRALESEFKKLFRLNEVFLDPYTYAAVLDSEVHPEDFNSEGYDVCPGADPSAISQTEKLVKAQALMEMLPLGTIDPMKATVRLLEALEIPNWQDLVAPDAAQGGQGGGEADAIAMEFQMKAQAEQQKAQLKQAELQMKSELANRDQEFKEKMETYKVQNQIQLEKEKARVQAAIQAHKDGANLAINQAKHNQKMNNNQQAHTQKMAQASKEASSNSRNTTNKSGSKAK